MNDVHPHIKMTVGLISLIFKTIAKPFKKRPVNAPVEEVNYEEKYNYLYQLVKLYHPQIINDYSNWLPEPQIETKI